MANSNGPLEQEVIEVRPHKPTQLEHNNDGIVEKTEIERDRGVVNKFISYISKLEEENKLHNTVNKATVLWEYLLNLEKTTYELNNRVGSLEEKISILEDRLESRKLYAPCFTNRKEKILKIIDEKKVIDVNEVKEVLGINSSNYARQIMQQVSKNADVAFVKGDSRTPSKLLCKHYTFQEIKDYLISHMPLNSTMLVSRMAQQFFIPEQKLPALLRSLHPQFKFLRWKDAPRIERIK